MAGERRSRRARRAFVAERAESGFAFLYNLFKLLCHVLSADAQRIALSPPERVDEYVSASSRSPHAIVADRSNIFTQLRLFLMPFDFHGQRETYRAGTEYGRPCDLLL